ncbi:HAD-IA family hydrolase [Spongiibacter sp. KMU-158]|uniref:HAD-IA family hydrolase n=1 Tax=Spongiibacter pelagi TaxID=2760804 RepID=A0A927C4Y3_9GAMM|nr:HAD-IA family hydrolase [Spongiibacter pelagi]MBD2859661.1 HAD-IA family hydrolase [Spongiibacter pelagi]
MLLIFDWDGTLLDSSAKIVGCMQKAALDCGYLPRTELEVQNIIGLELGLAIQQLYPDQSPAECLRIREAYVHHFIEADQVPCQFFAGVAEGLRALHGAGHTLCVATGKSRRGLNRVLSDLPEARLFSATRCADETSSKPDPLMLRELCEEFRVPAAQAVMVGDTEYDLEMASRLAMPSVGVSYGAHAVERLQRWQPISVIDHFSQLIPVLGRHFGEV